LSVYRTSKTKKKTKNFIKYILAKVKKLLKFTKTTEFLTLTGQLIAYFKIKKRIKYCNNKTNTKFVILSNELGRIMSVIAEIIDTLEKVVKLILKIKI
jgi:hypothetical protein